MSRPTPDEFAPFYLRYVDLVPENDVVAVLEAQPALLRAFSAGIPADREAFAYAPGKWTVRQVVGHCADAERVFGYRAFCFSRGEQTPLPGFDENRYVERSHFSDTPLAQLVDDFAQCRAASLTTLRTLTDAQWSNVGIANGKAISVRALAFVMAGHVRHHLHMLADRYGVDVGSAAGSAGAPPGGGATST